MCQRLSPRWSRYCYWNLSLTELEEPKESGLGILAKTPGGVGTGTSEMRLCPR